MQRDNYLDGEVERKRQETLIRVLNPHSWRSIFTLFRLKRNQSAVLLDELISRQAYAYYRKKESELPVSEEVPEAELDPYVVQLDTLRAYLPRMRKKRRLILEEIISGLATSFEGKDAKLQRYNSELQAEKEKVEELTAELKKVAVKRLITCLNAVKEVKKPLDWEILKLRQELEEPKTPKEPEKPIEEDEETDELENWDDLDELDEESDGADEEGGDETEPE